MKNNDYEVIFAIVNDGFADDVMTVAREQGARGGTIISARGVTKEDAAAFFGITLHSEKEIVMIVVPKTIKNDVLNAIYREMGMARKAQGLDFSLPVTDPAGLVTLQEPKAAEESKGRCASHSGL